MANEFEDKIKRHYQSLPKPKLSESKQNQLWDEISSQLAPEPKFKKTPKRFSFPWKVVAGVAAFCIALVLFVPEMMHSAGYSLGANLQQTINQSSKMNVKSILLEKNVKGGVYVFYIPKIGGDQAQSQLSVRYVQKTFWGGWKVTNTGGGYSSGEKKSIYVSYAPSQNSNVKPLLYGEVNNKNIKSVYVYDKNNHQLPSSIQVNFTPPKAFLWYAFIDPSKGSTFKIVGKTRADKQVTNVIYNIHSQSSSITKPTFDKFAALKKVIGKHPEFPNTPNKTITKEVSVGGPLGSKQKVDLTTQVSKKQNNSYIVTLTKDWHVIMNGTDVKSIYKYEVTPTSVKVLENLNLDHLAGSIK